MNQLHACLLLLLIGCGDDRGVAEMAPDAGQPVPDGTTPTPPPPPGIRFLDFALAIDVTPDGTLAVFEELTSEAAFVHFHDTITGESALVTSVGDPSRDVATGISATRRLSALHGQPVQAGVWSESTDWVDLGSPHGAGCGADEVAGAFDISADGSVVVGLAWDGCTADAFRWTTTGGTGAFTPLVVLGTPFAGGNATRPTNRATVVSDDGSVAAGFAQNGPIDRSPAVWFADGSGMMLDPANMDAPGEVLSISGDGVTVAGISANDGFLWTRGTGMVTLPRLPESLPSEPMFPNAMTADGSRIYGGLGSAFFGVPTAFVWSAEAGTQSLASVATAAGVALPEGLILNNVTAASSDGTVLIGTATDADFLLKTFVLRLPQTP